MAMLPVLTARKDTQDNAASSVWMAILATRKADMDHVDHALAAHVMITLIPMLLVTVTERLVNV
jgi:hypothetical protein